MQITRLSYFGSENQGLPLRSWFVTCWLWRHIPIVTSLAVPSSCVVTQTPMGTNSGTRRRERKFPLLFVNCDRGRIEIDHLYGLRCRGWYCNPEQHSLCTRATAGTTRAVPDCSTNHSSADRIVVNSYNPRPRVLGDEVVVGPSLMFMKMDPWNVIRNKLQDKTNKNQL